MTHSHGRMVHRVILCGAAVLLGGMLFIVNRALGADAKPVETPRETAKPPVTADRDKNVADTDRVYLTQQRDLWLDKKNKQLVMKGKIAVRKGTLEMFACPKGTKEHESIVAVACKAAPVHAGLLALGAKPGHPSKFDDSFHPATGAQIDVLVRWTGDDGKPHEAKGQDWIRNTKTGKSLEYPWVFGGSVFRTDPDTNEKYYLADSGDFICVANFPTAMMDLPIESPKDWSEHLFEPFTDRIPARDTEVELVLTPKPEKEKAREPDHK